MKNTITKLIAVVELVIVPTALAILGVVLVAMDVMYAEPQQDGMDELLNSMNEELRDSILENVPLPESFGGADQILARSLERRNVALGYAIADASNPPKGSLPPPLVMDSWLVESLVLIDIDSYIANLDLREGHR